MPRLKETITLLAALGAMSTQASPPSEASVVLIPEKSATKSRMELTTFKPSRLDAIFKFEPITPQPVLQSHNETEKASQLAPIETYGEMDVSKFNEGVLAGMVSIPGVSLPDREVIINNYSGVLLRTKTIGARGEIEYHFYKTSLSVIPHENPYLKGAVQSVWGWKINQNGNEIDVAVTRTSGTQVEKWRSIDGGVTWQDTQQRFPDLSSYK